MTTTRDIAQKYRKNVDEVKSALRVLGYEKRLSVVSKVSPDMEAKLDAYFIGEKRPAAKGVSRPPSVRRIGGTQVTEKKVRTINRPKPSSPAASPPAAPPPEKTAATTTTAKTDSAATAAADDLHQKQIAAQQGKSAAIVAPPKPAAETPRPAATPLTTAATPPQRQRRQQRRRNNRQSRNLQSPATPAARR